MIIFGPVPSRRLGRSLGINNIPPKVCTYSCVYCQLGCTMRMLVKRREFYKHDVILKKAGLRYVYEGNIPGEGGENTYCYSCGEAVIKRYGFEIIENILIDGKCPKCKNLIDGVGL